LKDLIDKKDSIAVNLNRCPVKTEKGEVEEEEEEREEKEERGEEEKEEEGYTTTTTSLPSITPSYIPVVTDVTEDPLLEVKDVGYREQEVKSEEDKYETEFVETSVEPVNLSYQTSHKNAFKYTNKIHSDSLNKIPSEFGTPQIF